MNIKPLIPVLTITAALFAWQPLVAQTIVIPFSDIRQEIDTSGGDPDEIIRAHLAGLIRGELDQRGFDVDGGLVFSDIPIDEITRTIRTDCDFLRPYEVHTDATTATVSLDDSSSLTIALDSIRSIDISANLTGDIETEADAWVRWGLDIPFGEDCRKIDTDHGWVGLKVPLEIDLSLMLDLEPTYDPDQVAIVVDKHALLAGQARFRGGKIQHEFGPVSLTDLVLDVFEDALLEALDENGTEAVANVIARLNNELDGLDEDGNPDPTIEAFNGPSTFILDVDEEDKAFIREMLADLGIPELVLAMVDERGVEILLQLVLLEGAERDAYLAGLGAEVGCEAILGTYLTGLERVPLYTVNNEVCEVADTSAPGTGRYFSDPQCVDEVAFTVTDETEFCLAQFDPQSETLLGNAAAWSPDTDQPNDELPGVESRAWTVVPSTALDLFTVSIQDNHQPYMKQLKYKTIPDLTRGTGVCELEMRVYKRDIADQDLKPLLAIHGGTWQHRGSSFIGLEASASHLTERGFVVFAPFYRLVGDKDGNVECNAASWREATADVESALEWVLQHGAAFGANSNQVSVFGQSAGAHLAAWLAAHRGDEVRKALLFYGPTDLLEYLAGAVTPGGPYEAYRNFGLRAISNLYGAEDRSTQLQLGQMSFAGVTAELLEQDWPTLIPDAVFDLNQIDPLAPPPFVARCAALTGTDLASINLALPPPSMTDCLKEDLSEFLVSNSFNHRLGANEVPLYALHGSGDTIVPHAQAVHLCAAIDDSVLAADVIDPLTAFSCGTWSKVQIVKDAEHAFDLGVCYGPLCPAGLPGGATRSAATTAITAAYAWLQQDPAPDTDGDGIADDTDTDDDNDGISDEWEIANGLDPLDASDALLDYDLDGLTNLDEYLLGSDPHNADTDGDAVPDGNDNCAAAANPGQEDADRDGRGNACDAANALAPSDHDGDGKSDVLWRHSVGGETRLYSMSGASIAANQTINATQDLNWRFVGTGDYDGDGNADILMRNSVTGQNWMYLLDGSAIVQSQQVNNNGNQQWQVAGNGDYDGDGKSDILWRNFATGQNWLYLMDGPTIRSSQSINVVADLNWKVAGSGDLNGDGKSDIVWRHSLSGRNWLYLMNGPTIASSVGINQVSDLDWQLVGTGDHNGDGMSDLLWRHARSGQNWLYLMNGSTIASSVGINKVGDSQWKIVGQGDYNGDGTADILWRHFGSGQNWLYLLNGSSILSSQGINVEPDLGQEVVNLN